MNGDFEKIDKWQVLRDLYLYGLLTDKIAGPLTGKPSVDKPWLVHYTEEQIKNVLPHDSIYNLLYEVNKDNLDMLAIDYYGTKFTFIKFFEEIDKCANAYKEYGVKKGDIVTLCMPNIPEAIISFYALNKIGAVANMIHPLSSEKEIEFYLNEVNSKIMLVVDMNYKKILNIKDNTALEKVIVVSPSNSMPLFLKAGYKVVYESKYDFKIEYNDTYINWNKFIHNGKVSSIEKVEANPMDLAVIFHTGGTTGTPKGVKITNDQYNSSITQIQIDNDIVDVGDKLLALMPIFHGFGSSNCVHLAFCSRVSIILVPKFDRKNFHKLIKNKKPNHILAVPTIFEAIMNNQKLNKADLSFLKYLIAGGDKLKATTEEEFKKFSLQHNIKEPLLKAFGLTEAVGATTRTRRNMNEENSVGIPFIKNTYKVVEVGTENELPVGELGELCINGPSVMQGYYNNEEETNRVLKVHLDGKLWLHTGDLGYITTDGVVYYGQRQKRMIITNGYNVYPAQIEEMIEKHPSVEKCIVFGVADERKSEAIIVVIVPKNNEINFEQLQSEVKKLCVENLPKYSLPKDILIKTKLPVTLMNKIDVNKLSEDYCKVKRLTT